MSGLSLRSIDTRHATRQPILHSAQRQALVPDRLPLPLSSHVRPPGVFPLSHRYSCRTLLFFLSERCLRVAHSISLAPSQSSSLSATCPIITFFRTWRAPRHSHPPIPSERLRSPDQPSSPYPAPTPRALPSCLSAKRRSASTAHRTATPKTPAILHLWLICVVYSLADVCGNADRKAFRRMQKHADVAAMFAC